MDRAAHLSVALAALLAAACAPKDASTVSAPVAPAASTAGPAAKGEASRATGTPATPTHWRCEELTVAATHDGQAGTLRLEVSGRRLELPADVAASGARYADAAGNVFWNKGAEATLSLAGDPPRSCVHADRPSPWFEAAARRVAFRAVGNEPGWLVELGGGDRPALRAELDYGERVLALPRMDGADGGATAWTGRTADGEAVSLEVERQECADGMSGERFEARARLRVGDRTYEGCGAFLAD